ncbi:unnamed protein product [Amaranthus hypochondriacus]
MVAYPLTDSLEFVGVESALTGLKVLKARNKDEANPSSGSFTSGATIGSGASIYTELNVFNGTVSASSLPGLIGDLRDSNLWVNRDGYCYIRILGSNSPNSARPPKFMRLNDLFNWKDYADVPTNQTFTPTPPTTLWNRLASSGGPTPKIDYEKLDADLKQAKDDKKKAEDDKKKADEDKKKAEIDKKRAEDDKKKAEDDKKRAENDKKKAEDDKKRAEDDKKRAENDKKKAEDDKKKAEDAKKRAEDDKKRAEDAKKRAEDDKKRAENDKKRAEEGKKRAEDELQEVRKQKREMNEWMDRLKENWVKAASVGAKPLPPSAFYISSISNPTNAGRSQPLQSTWLREIQKPLLDPGSYMGRIRTGSIQVYDSADVYGNDGFETHFWWVVRLDEYPYLIIFDGTGPYPIPTDQSKFQSIRVVNTFPFGVLRLPGLDYEKVILHRI